MSGFSAEWLGLREPADHRARNPEIASALSARLAQRETVSVVDIGCGAASNLKATTLLLPDRQTWRLVDYDADLLIAARERLMDWADTAETNGNQLHLEKGGKRIDVTFHQFDLNADLEGALGEHPDLVTSAAFFDLTSVAFMQKFAAAVVARKSAFYTVLTYNGRQRWSPHHPSDNAIVAAFHRHQMRDKGFGPAAGPTAALELGEQFRLHGYSVLEGDSPWDLAPSDAALIAELQAGHAAAAAETGAVDAKTLERWLGLKRTGAIIGHTDTLALPG